MLWAKLSQRGSIGRKVAPREQDGSSGGKDRPKTKRVSVTSPSFQNQETESKGAFWRSLLYLEGQLWRWEKNFIDGSIHAHAPTHFVCPSVDWSVGRSVTFYFFFFDLTAPAQIVSPCPPARDFGSRVSGLVLYRSREFNETKTDFLSPQYSLIVMISWTGGCTVLWWTIGKTMLLGNFK